MQYLLLIYNDEPAIRAASRERTQRVIGEYTAYTQALKNAGVYVGSNRLQFTDTARTVRLRDGRTSAVDGPYTETKEQLGGYYMIDVADMESALEWAARCPGAAYGAIEVRPVWAT